MVAIEKCLNCEKLSADLDALRADVEFAWDYDRMRMRLIAWMDRERVQSKVTMQEWIMAQNALRLLNESYFDVPHAREQTDLAMGAAQKAIEIFEERYGGQDGDE